MIDFVEIPCLFPMPSGMTGPNGQPAVKIVELTVSLAVAAIMEVIDLGGENGTEIITRTRGLRTKVNYHQLLKRIGRVPLRPLERNGDGLD